MRTAGSSSSATSALTNGTFSSNAGRNGRRTTAHANSVPRPLTGAHSSARLHAGHEAWGYQTYAAHPVHRVTVNSPRAAPAKNGAVIGSSTSGNGKSARLIAMTLGLLPALGEDQRARHVARVTAVHRNLRARYLRRCDAAHLLHALDDMRDAEHVRVRQQPAVRVERALAGIVEQRVALHERARVA